MSPFWRAISFPLVRRQEPRASSFLPTLTAMLSLANGSDGGLSPARAAALT